MTIDISILIPAYNEEQNVSLLYERLKKVLFPLKGSYELIFIDDGSKDKTLFELKKF
jgi:polyisoprenyl-phosphate glycosyltransferase